MDVQLGELRGFLITAEERNFTRAAERLHLTQPGLSRLIQRLERKLGTRLLDRTTRNVTLTPAGIRLFGELSELLPRLDDALRPDPQSSVLRLGFTWGLPDGWTHRTIRRMEQDAPGVRVQLTRRDEPLAGLLRNAVDIAILRGTVPRRGLTVVTLLYEERVAAVSSLSPLSSRKSFDWEELPGLPLVLNTVSGTTTINSWPAGRSPSRVSTCSNFDEWLESVAAGRGVGVVPASVVHRYPHPEVRFVPVHNAPAVPLSLAFRSQAAHPLARRFVNIAWEEVHMEP